MNFPSYGYLAILIFSLGGLAVLDRRYRLAFWGAPRRSLGVIALGVALFLAWDGAGILLGIFRTNQDYVIGLHLVTPNLPLEEVLLLSLICYLTLLGSTLLERRGQ